MLRFCLSSSSLAAIARPRAAVLRAVSAATRASGSAAGTNDNASAEKSAAPAAPAAGTTTPAATEAKAEEQRKPYEFHPEEILKAVRAGDMAKVQSTATELVQHKWKEEYTLPAACVVVFVILWYWVAWTRRSVRRKCAATEAAARQEARETVDMVRSLTEKWSKNIAKSDEQTKAIIEKNSTLTADIDRMTTVLRSCSIRPTSNSLSSIAKTRVATPVTSEPGTPSLPESSSASSEAAPAAAMSGKDE